MLTSILDHYVNADIEKPSAAAMHHGAEVVDTQPQPTPEINRKQSASSSKYKKRKSEQWDNKICFCF